MVTVAERRPTDEHLGELTAAGDLDAFTALFDRHFQGIYDLALRIVGDPETAADVVYDALISAWTALRRVLDALREAHPYEEVAFDLIRLHALT